MGTKNRERRKMKQNKRRKDVRKEARGQERLVGGGWSDDLGDTTADIAILAAAHGDCDDRSFAVNNAQVASLADGLGSIRGRPLVAKRVAALLARDLGHLLEAGWEPADLVRVVRRHAGATAASFVIGPIKVAIAQRDRPGNDSFNSVLADVGPARELDPDDESWHTNLSAAIDALHVLEHLPVLPDLGSLGSPGRKPSTDHEERALARIRSLLAKAESTEFPEEADAFMAKAQDLMTRHCIDRAVLDERPDAAARSQVEARRIWLEDPYLQPKSMLLAEVADANRCRAVVSPKLGFSTVVGFPADLEATELLFTSLLVQATRRLGMLGRETVNGRRSRRPSYRRSFLVAYAGRIGARLREASQAATAEADEALGKRLLPVLARREDEVEDAVTGLFGRIGSLKLSATDHAGWAAGSAAADMADLAGHQTLLNEASG